MTPDIVETNPELLRLEVLRTYKVRFGQNPDFNHSPFTQDQIIRYRTKVGEYDVTSIHQRVRETIDKSLKEIRQGHVSQVGILTGNPGMGKTHLINSYRQSEKQKSFGYVLVCNSNHWKPKEFEECLLDWILASLTEPSPNEPHLLLERIQDIAFEALRQIVNQPGEIDRFKRRTGWNPWTKIKNLFVSEPDFFKDAIKKRNSDIFRRLDFKEFSEFVCRQFLAEPNRTFHRYTMKMLLRYLFQEDREKVLHWLHRNRVDGAFLKELEVETDIDRKDKAVDVTRILISLFTPEVTNSSTGIANGSPRDRVFFLAFDQAEAREALFETDVDWRTFFTQLSELYNTLPNLFILFTMTKGLRDRYIAQMEGQFKDRIRHDTTFQIDEIPNEEVLELYRQRLRVWLGDEGESIQSRLQNLGNPFIPFNQEQILQFASKRTLRHMLVEFDHQFRQQMEQLIVDVQLDFRVYQNELRLKENSKGFTNSHLKTVETILKLCGQTLCRDLGLELTTYHSELRTTDDLPVLFMEFREAQDPKLWIRVYFIRLGFVYREKIPHCLQLLYDKTKTRNLLWLVREDRIDSEAETSRPGQAFCRGFPLATETTLQSLIQVFQNRDKYPTSSWTEGEPYLLSQLKNTYLGELFSKIREGFNKLKKMPDQIDESVSSEQSLPLGQSITDHQETRDQIPASEKLFDIYFDPVSIQTGSPTSVVVYFRSHSTKMIRTLEVSTSPDFGRLSATAIPPFGSTQMTLSIPLQISPGKIQSSVIWQAEFSEDSPQRGEISFEIMVV